MPDWMQWIMGIVASVTATGLIGVVAELRSQAKTISRLEAETERLPKLEDLLREVREMVAAIKARIDRDE